jgi:putative aldouronate transport system permease protein
LSNWKPKQSRAEIAFSFFNVVFLALFSFSVLFPFLRQINLSISNLEESQRVGLHVLPNLKALSLSAYARVFAMTQIRRAYFWTVTRTLLGTALTLAVTAMFAYPLSRKYLPLRTFFTSFVIFTMFFGGGLIPTYLLIRSLGMVNTIWALVLPSLIDPFTLIIMRNFMMSLSEELIEAARIDGANELYVFSRIIIPLSKAVLATVALWSMVGHWNAYFDAIMYLSTQKIQILQLVLRQVLLDAARYGGGELAELSRLMNQNSSGFTPMTLKAAILIVAIAPILIAYPFLQKYFVKGIMIGSLKG